MAERIPSACERRTTASSCTVASILGTEAIARYLESLVEAGKSARTHNFHRSAAVTLCRWLVDYDYLARNHASVVRTMNEQKDSRRPSRPLTVAEAEALLLQAAPERRLYYLFRLRTGLRGSGRSPLPRA